MITPNEFSMSHFIWNYEQNDTHTDFTQIQWVCRSQTKGTAFSITSSTYENKKKLKCKYPMEQWIVLENKKKILEQEKSMNALQKGCNANTVEFIVVICW